MKIILTTDRVYGYGAIQRAGDTIELPPEEALRMIKSGQAEAIVDVIETAMDEPREELRGKLRRDKHATPVK